MKVLKFRTFDEKRAITPRWIIRFSSKLQGSKLDLAVQIILEAGQIGPKSNRPQVKILKN